MIVLLIVVIYWRQYINYIVLSLPTKQYLVEDLPGSNVLSSDDIYQTRNLFLGLEENPGRELSIEQHPI